MRYYRIVITDKNTKQVFREYSSLDAAGNYLPGALNVEFDIPVIAYGNPGSGAYVRIWGIPLSDISQSTDFNDKLITVYGGMSKGLPLANPAQQGVLTDGFIFQAFGNWRGTVQTLDLIIMPGGGNQIANNYSFTWKQGQPLYEVIQSVLTPLYPNTVIDTSGMNQTITIAADQPGSYTNLAEFAQYIKTTTEVLNILTTDGSAYTGVQIISRAGKILAVDNSVKSEPKQINITDLIGQPTWISPTSFQFSCVMRGDLNINDLIKMPVAQFTTSPQSLARFRDNSKFQGIGRILGSDACIRHVGNYRQPDGESWITTVNCVVSQ